MSASTITEKPFTVTYSARSYGAANYLEREYTSGTSHVYADSRDDARSMVENDLFERGWVLQVAAINRDMEWNTAYESLTLHNLCESVWMWRHASSGHHAARKHEQYWLDKLESFFTAI